MPLSVPAAPLDAVKAVDGAAIPNVCAARVVSPFQLAFGFDPFTINK